jgi:hypothetical protein
MPTAYEQGSGIVSFTANSGVNTDKESITFTPPNIWSSPSSRTVEVLLENPEPEWLVSFASLSTIDDANKSTTESVVISGRPNLLDSIDMPTISVSNTYITNNLN